MTGAEDDPTQSETPDPLDDLARQYLSLWQDQLTALSANPAVSEAISGFFAKWAQGAAPGAPAGPANPTGEAQDGLRPNRPQSPDVAPPLRPASLDGDGRFDELLERLDRIEERLARLERS
ncbi:MAG: hypothetical protein OXH87_03995 [Rhodospirillaceae bacterium]|nr:hypothetical protein [Rhodospirillaceae bacterium]